MRDFLLKFICWLLGHKTKRGFMDAVYEHFGELEKERLYKHLHAPYVEDLYAQKCGGTFHIRGIKWWGANEPPEDISTGSRYRFHPFKDNRTSKYIEHGAEMVDLICEVIACERSICTLEEKHNLWDRLDAFINKIKEAK